MTGNQGDGVANMGIGACIGPAIYPADIFKTLPPTPFAVREGLKIRPVGGLSDGRSPSVRTPETGAIKKAQYLSVWVLTRIVVTPR